MTGPKVDNKLSVGNLITIAILLVTIAGGWYQFETRLSLMEQQVLQNTAVLTRLQTERDDTRDRLTRLEVRLAGIDRTLERIARAVGAER